MASDFFFVSVIPANNGYYWRTVHITRIAILLSVYEQKTDLFLFLLNLQHIFSSLLVCILYNNVSGKTSVILLTVIELVAEK